MDWYCVHIEHIRAATAVNATFRKMLLDEYRDVGQPRDCHVYHDSTPGGDFYYFSPGAAQALKSLRDFWKGFEVPEPALWNQMEEVV